MKLSRLAFRLRFFSPVIVGCLTSFPATSWATTLFSNINQSFSGINRLQFTTDRVATDFSTGGSATTLQSTTLEIFNTNLTNDFNAHTFTARIFTDNAGVPGSLVGSFSTFTINASSSVSNGFGTTPGINLTANTKYWEVLQINETASTENAGWFHSTSQSTDGGSSFSVISGTQVKSSSDSGSTWSDAFVGNSVFRLDGIATVPEPSTCILAALSLLGGCILRRRIV